MPSPLPTEFDLGYLPLPGWNNVIFEKIVLSNFVTGEQLNKLRLKVVAFCVCMHVFNDRERADCPKKTILGRK